MTWTTLPLLQLLLPFSLLLDLHFHVVALPLEATVQHGSKECLYETLNDG